MAKKGSAGLAVIYETRRQRTVAMTLSAMEAVKKAVQPISLSAIVAASRRIDPADRGISSSAILRNPEACSIYEGARTWRAPVIAHPRLSEPRNPFAIPVKVGRRGPVSRHRLSRLTKSELIEQLLEIQNAYATVRAAWLELNGRLLSRGSKTDRHGHVPRKP